MQQRQISTMPDGSPIFETVKKFSKGDMVVIGKIHTSRGSLVYNFLKKYEGKVATIEEILKTKRMIYCVRPIGASGTLRLNPDEMKLFVSPEEVDMDPEREAFEAFEQHHEDYTHPDNR